MLKLPLVLFAVSLHPNERLSFRLGVYWHNFPRRAFVSINFLSLFSLKRNLVQNEFERKIVGCQAMFRDILICSPLQRCKLFPRWWKTNCNLGEVGYKNCEQSSRGKKTFNFMCILAAFSVPWLPFPSRWVSKDEARIKCAGKWRII